MASFKELFSRHTVTKKNISRIRRICAFQRNYLVKASFVNAFINGSDKQTNLFVVHLRIFFAELLDRVEVRNEKSVTVLFHKGGYKLCRKVVRNIRFG